MKKSEVIYISEELLNKVESGDIFNLTDTQIVNLDKLKWALAQHKQDIFKNSKGLWQTSFPEPTAYKGRLKRARKNKSELYDLIIEYYTKKASNFKAIYESWIAFKQETVQIKPQSITRYDNDYNRFISGTDFESIPIESLTEKELRDFIITQIQKHELTAKSLSGLRIILISTLKHAKAEGYQLTFSPAEFFENLDVSGLCTGPHPRREAFSDKEALVIMRVCKEVGDVVALCISLAFYTGVRIGELTSVRWDDVNMEEGYIDIAQTSVIYKDRETGQRVHTVQDRPKTDAGQRTITLNKEALCIIKKLRLLTGRNEFVCSDTTDGHRIESSTIQKRLNRICDTYTEDGVYVSPKLKKEGKAPKTIRRLGIHGIRRMVGTKLMDDKSISKDTVRKIMGHKDIRTTEEYYLRKQTDIPVEREIMNSAIRYRA